MKGSERTKFPDDDVAGHSVTGGARTDSDVWAEPVCTLLYVHCTTAAVCNCG